MNENTPVIPDVSNDELQAAMMLFDTELRLNEEWKDWTNKKNFRYAIFHNNKLYPVKTVVSLATGIPVSDFSGGGRSNSYVSKRGLSVITLKSHSWKIESGVLAEKILDKSAFVHRGTGIPYEIRPFFVEGELKQGESRPVSLVHEDAIYAAHINMEGQDTARTRLFWNTEFSKLLREKYPYHYNKYSSDEEPESEISLTFKRLSNFSKYEVLFTDPVSDNFETYKIDFAYRTPKHWIFQSNPDIFDIDTYLANNTDIIWSVRQKHFVDEMHPGDEVFIWRASGNKGLIAGIVAKGLLTGKPREMKIDEASRALWIKGVPDKLALRVPIKLELKCLGAKEIIRREWLKYDPVVSGTRILKFSAETNYLIGTNEAERLATLIRNTGRHWNRDESLAGLWAYTQTIGKPVSKLPGSPVAEVALTIGRAVTGVYNKVMNFRSLDETDVRDGLSAGGHVDESVWNEFFDAEKKTIRLEELNKEYSRLWGKSKTQDSSKLSYKDFGDAPNDDPNELQQFSARVRRGQLAFRKNLLAAYSDKCIITGHGPAEVLDAVHIEAHAKCGVNELDNGLLMRGDLHSLFDANLLRINPETMQIVIDEILSGTPYWQMNGKKIAKRVDGSQIRKKYLKQRWESIK